MSQKVLLLHHFWSVRQRTLDLDTGAWGQVHEDGDGPAVAAGLFGCLGTTPAAMFVHDGRTQVRIGQRQWLTDDVRIELAEGFLTSTLAIRAGAEHHAWRYRRPWGRALKDGVIGWAVADWPSDWSDWDFGRWLATRHDEFDMTAYWPHTIDGPSVASEDPSP